MMPPSATGPIQRLPQPLSQGSGDAGVQKARDMVSVTTMHNRSQTMTAVLSRRAFFRASALVAAGTLASACAAPAATPSGVSGSPAEPTVAAPGEPTSRFREAPPLAEQVQAGALPPVEDRLPADPLVVPVTEEIGQYGGTWHRCAVGPSDCWTAGRLAYENLIRYTKDGVEIVMNLATNYVANDDGSEYTFYLREGMKWSDGEPFGADDFLFYFQDGLSNTDLSPTFPSDLCDPVNGEPMVLEKVDDYTIKFRFQSPYGLFIKTLASYTGTDMFRWPAHYLKQFHPTYADAAELDKAIQAANFTNWWELFANRRDWQNLDCPTICIWKPTRVPPDVPVVWERNPYYWKVDPEGNQLPYLDAVEFQIVENADLANLKAIAGEVDMQFRHLLLANYPLFVDNAEQGDYRVMQWKDGWGPNCHLYFNFNHKNPDLHALFNNRDFRIALSLGIKREDINQLIYMGMGRPMQATATPDCPYSKEEYITRWTEHDPDTANAMLDEIGLADRDGEGFRLLPSGEPLSIVVEYAVVFGPWRDVITMVAEHWKDLGLRIITKEEDRSLYQQRTLAGEHDMTCWGMGGAYNPLLGPSWWWPNNQMAPEWWRWNASKGKEGEEPPEEVKLQYALYEQIKGASTSEDLDKYAQQFVDNHSEQLWLIGTVGFVPMPVVVKNNFRNVPDVAIGDDRAKSPGCTNIEQYFIKQA
jgi:peptide/nickel transport system substrate-binding protein